MAKTMTIEQLTKFAAAEKFTVLDENNGGGNSERKDGYDEDGRVVLVSTGYANVTRTLTAVSKAIKVIYSVNAEWDGSENSRVSDEFTEYPEQSDPTWVISGVTLVDEDGEKLDEATVHNALNDIFGSRTQHDMTMVDTLSLIPAVETNDIGIEENDMEITELDIDGAPNLRFTGECIASVSSKNDDSQRWTVLTLYKTKGGKFICHSKGYSRFVGESTRYSGTVASDAAGVIAFFGHGRLAKELYDDANIEDVQDVE